MNRRNRTTLLATSLIVAMACSNTAVDRPLDAPADWRIDEVPELVIGDDPSASTAVLGYPRAAYLLPDGGVVVADYGLHGLRYFDREGNYLRQVGREGEGPGEFRYLARMLRCGDSLHTQDIQLRRMGVFGLDGELARSYSPGGPDPVFDYPYHLACGSSGRMLANGWDTVRTAEYSRVRGSVPYWLYNADGSVDRVLGSWPGSERLSSPGGSSPHPLGKEAVIAVGSDRVYIGTADSFSIEVIDFGGNRLPSISKQSVELTTTPADIDRDRLLDTLGKSEGDIAWEVQRWQQFEYPPTVPAYTAMVVDRGDNLWVRTFPRSDADLVRWVVFSSDGEEIGSVDLPASLEVSEIGPDWILGIRVSLDDGSLRVVKHRLYRRE